MNEYRYITVKQEFGEGSTARIGYGIAAVLVYDECVQLMQSFDDLSDDKDLIRRFADMCNALQVEIIHFADVVEDFMAIAYGE